MKHPVNIPIMAGSGIDVAGKPKLTPPMNTTASRPSRRTVMNGKKNIAYFSARCLNRVLTEPVRSSLASRALASLTRHFSCSFDTRRSAAPIRVIIREATRAKTPSQIYSVPAHLSFPRP